MKFLAVLFCTIIVLLGSMSNATDLTIVNHTGDQIRILRLTNKCKGDIITENSPVYIQNNQQITIKNTIPVIHTYEICGSGYCAGSAIGFKKAKQYTLEIVLKHGVISGNATPDDWVGNVECPVDNFYNKCEKKSCPMPTPSPSPSKDNGGTDDQDDYETDVA